MTEPCPAGGADERAEGALDLPGLLHFAATPTFAMMAMLSASADGPGAMCLALPGDGMLGGMMPMYLLMAVFHAAPWLRLLPGARGQPRATKSINARSGGGTRRRPE